MAVRISGEARQIATAINAFPHAYHVDFLKVREMGRQYLADAAPSAAVVTNLGQALRWVLGNWGAGKREAPELRGAMEFAQALGQPEIQTCLAELQGTPLSVLSLPGRHPYMNGKLAEPEQLARFDTSLFEALSALASGLFIGNTNATYPMKAVLLITGLMPAFDSQVRAGLQRGGFLGMDKTQYLLPADARHADGKKIAQLPFLLGECWRAYSQQLREGIRSSQFPELLVEPGRAFDLLLFMQGDAESHVLVTCDPPGRGWYTVA